MPLLPDWRMRFAAIAKPFRKARNEVPDAPEEKGYTVFHKSRFWVNDEPKMVYTGAPGNGLTNELPKRKNEMT